MVQAVRTDALDTISRSAHLIRGEAGDLAPILEMVGKVHFVLLGEASRGTHEFYAMRAEITKRLIREKGVTAVAVEADWPDAYRVNRYVRGMNDDATAEEALCGFVRFPTWIWRNTVVRDFVEWLRAHNASLAQHFARQGQPAKFAVWEHNSHLGDVRATEMGRRGEWNVGQLVRERHGDDVRIVGFTTHRGWVTAATDWGGPAERKRVRPALPGSYEDVLHQTELDRFAVLTRSRQEVIQALAGPRLERAIGVIYRPETERISHYFVAWLPDQLDAVIHLDETRALQSLKRTAPGHWRAARDVPVRGVTRSQAPGLGERG